MTGIRGSFFDGSRSGKQSAMLQYAGGRVSVTGRDGATLAGPQRLAEVDISPRLGNTPRFLRFADGGVFETGENVAIDGLVAGIRPRSGLLHHFESRMGYVIVALVVTVGFVWTSIQYGIPAVAKYTAFSLSPESNRRLGQGTMALLDRFYVAPSRLSAERQQHLRERFLQFIPVADGMPVEIEFRDGRAAIGANAFALPSGTVVFTDQLVRLAQNDEELLAVYAHEVGHLVQRHIMRQVLQNSALTAVVVAVTGDISSVSSLVAAVPVVVTQAGYSRSFEREADRYAVEQLRLQAVDVSHFATILQKIEVSHRCRGADEEECLRHVENQWEKYLSTHPATRERIEALGR